MKDEITSPADEITTNAEIGVERMPQTNDIGTFVECLRSTDEYQGQLVVRQGKIEKQRDELVSKGLVDRSEFEELSSDEVFRSWEERDEFKDLCFDFASRVIHLKYDADKFSPEINNLFTRYREVAATSVHINQASGYAPEQKREAELTRNQAHHELALKIYQHLLNEGVYKEEKGDELRGEIMGRCIARCWLVDCGEDIWASARTMDIVRRANAVPLEQSESVLKAQRYKAGSQRWFEKERDVLEARRLVMPILTHNQLAETANMLTFFRDVDENIIEPELGPQDNQEHAPNPLRGGRHFS